ncbi:cupin domain-containing protein [Chitinophaga pinensis]|uniref:Cupin 2 conserved barrel domain protein n=1 Tax=Chitinophaga pinensis (strain ATCC 43595 / DSM 2588 / LMG 13176 / NBRC 15968 / NCIMB 11800 / UQM 2034) TaxID=485918 RepID=A0A979GT23_CHIPD|nr:cupin domain-containing protein [Chitinophaga pinensis]ACU63487.1 Cupin 2 conserved barrel domain protein [Chitinophaga pinensis DSM 2588]
MENTFQKLSIQTGVLYTNADRTPNYSIIGVSGNKISLPPGVAYFGIVYQGHITVTDKFGTCTLSAGMSFVVSEGEVDASRLPDGQGIIIRMENYKGLRQFCGPIEDEGRLKYLDNCYDTIIVSPAKSGDPCLNHLHIPKQVKQTPHTHPSDRVGIVIKGQAECILKNETTMLQPGHLWVIPPDCLHSFNTYNEAIDLITWHPDSDFGPTDDNHPMINRTVPVNK